MNKEGFNPYQAHEKRINFIENAVAEGVLDRIPISERDQNIALVYCLNEELTGKKVGILFPQSPGIPLGKESVRQKGERFLKAAYNMASPQLKAEHPIAELLTRKLSALNAVNARIKGIVERGANPETIRNMLGSPQLQSTRRTLRRHGVEIPLMHSAYEDVKVKVEAETDDKKLQEFLDSLSANQLKGFLQGDSNRETLTTASAIANEQGFHAHTKRVRFIAETIERARIPIKQTVRLRKNGELLGSYYIVYAKHAGRIAEALRNDPDLQRFR